MVYMVSKYSESSHCVESSSLLFAKVDYMKIRGRHKQFLALTSHRARSGVYGYGVLDANNAAPVTMFLSTPPTYFIRSSLGWLLGWRPARLLARFTHSFVLRRICARTLFTNRARPGRRLRVITDNVINLRESQQVPR